MGEAFLRYLITWEIVFHKDCNNLNPQSRVLHSVSTCTHTPHLISEGCNVAVGAYSDFQKLGQVLCT